MIIENATPSLIANTLSYIQNAPDENLFASRTDIFGLFKNRLGRVIYLPEL